MARRLGTGIIAVIGYLLSPLSWWNDPFVNLPLAWLFASLISLASHRLFAPAMILGYWLTNVLGFLLMQKGAQQIVPAKPRRYSRRDLLRDVGISLLYTALIVALVELGILQPLKNYFPAH